jgi:hypothetical protein
MALVLRKFCKFSDDIAVHVAMDNTLQSEKNTISILLFTFLCLGLLGEINPAYIPWLGLRHALLYPPLLECYRSRRPARIPLKMFSEDHQTTRILWKVKAFIQTY